MIEATRRYVPADREALCRFQERFFGNPSRQLEEDRFRWLFTENPEESEAKPEIWLCVREEVVGQQSGILHRLKVGDQEMRGSWAIDLMVDPAWRLRGVGPALVERHARSHPIVIALGATDALYPVLLKAGWTDLGYIPIFIRPLRLSGLDSWWKPRGSRAKAAAWLAQPALFAANVWNDVRCRSVGLSAEPIPSFDERVDEIWKRCAPEYPVIARRDRTWLVWRFDRSPYAPLYRRFLVFNESSAVGYFVLRAGMLLQAPVCFLADYLCPLRQTGALLDLAVRTARRMNTQAGQVAVNPPAALVTSTLNLRAASAFTRAGFLSIKKRTRRRLLYRIQPDLAALHPLLADRENWFVTRADSDADHVAPHRDTAGDA
jgi:GNAT superfamily N-acetyltransferase